MRAEGGPRAPHTEGLRGADGGYFQSCGRSSTGRDRRGQVGSSGQCCGDNVVGALVGAGAETGAAMERHRGGRGRRRPAGGPAALRGSAGGARGHRAGCRGPHACVAAARWGHPRGRRSRHGPGGARGLGTPLSVAGGQLDCDSCFPQALAGRRRGTPFLHQVGGIGLASAAFWRAAFLRSKHPAGGARCPRAGGLRGGAASAARCGGGAGGAVRLAGQNPEHVRGAAPHAQEGCVTTAPGRRLPRRSAVPWRRRVPGCL
mmetsp:Transcript_29912/g.95402  ORF Transcript_29912/g.95402 Transcript_29912/m.95402 type:complete len:260 (-) Transcript_29912:445-1224(-)